MAKEDEIKQNRDHVKGKGKGKGNSENDGSQGGSFFEGMAKSAQSFVNPESIASVISSNGKALPTANRLPSSINQEYVRDVRQASSSETSADYTGAQSSFRQRGAGDETDFHTFANGVEPAEFADTSLHTSSFPDRHTEHGDWYTENGDLRRIGPYQTARQLDPSFHAHLQSYEANRLDKTWMETVSGSQAGTNSTLNEQWMHHTFPHNAAVGGVQERPNGFQNVEANSNDFMSALAADTNVNEMEQSMNATSMSDGLSTHWRAPSPSRRGELTVDQYNMHRALAEKQDKDHEERTQPPDDDEAARTGVYAATPEQALQSIWQGPVEGQRASEVVRPSASVRGSDGANVVRNVRRLLARGTYVDDVYGIPPVLHETLALAEEPETDDNREMRAKAIARLDTLYRHLEASPAVDPPSLNHLTKGWT